MRHPKPITTAVKYLTPGDTILDGTEWRTVEFIDRSGSRASVNIYFSSVLPPTAKLNITSVIVGFED